MGVIKPSELRRVNLDTAVQEKHIRFPTDPRLYDRMRERLVMAARREGLKLRQSYVRVGKRLPPSRVATPTLNNADGRVDARADSGPSSAGSSAIERANCPIGARRRDLLALARRLHVQERHDKGKLYSVHAPEVECISKGKAHKRYEFGCKVALAVSSKAGGFWRRALWRATPTTATQPEHDGSDRREEQHRTRARLLRHELPGPRLRGGVPDPRGTAQGLDS